MSRRPSRTHLKLNPCTFRFSASYPKTSIELSHVDCGPCRRSKAALRVRAYLRPDVRERAHIILDWFAENGIAAKLSPEMRKLREGLKADGVDYRAVIRSARRRAQGGTEPSEEDILGPERLALRWVERIFSLYSSESLAALVRGDADAERSILGFAFADIGRKNKLRRTRIEFNQGAPFPLDLDLVRASRLDE